jgi:uncharacterized protein
MQYCETSLLVVQPTPFCNIDCSYCYLPDRSSKKRLSFENAQTIFKKVLAFPTIGDSITIVWHAGEPLVLPVSYYERMFQLIGEVAPRHLQVRHSFQTNGTLITDEWCDFIKRWRLNVGVSIDGPAEIHDLNRKQRNGAGSFERAYKGLRKLQDAKIPSHVISVLTIESMAEPEKMLNFYLENAIDHVCFNIEEQEGLNSKSKLIGSRSPDVRYREFLERFVHLSLQRNEPILIREIENSMRAIQAHGKGMRNQQSEPFAIVSMDCDGNLSTFSPELVGLEHEIYGSFCFGNLLQHDFDEIASRISASRLYADIQAGVRRCADTCAYYGLCGGGAPVNKIYENGSAATTETVYCRTLMRSVDIVLDLIERIPPDLITRWIGARTETGPIP